MKQPIIWIRQPRTGGTSMKWALLYGGRQVDRAILDDPDSFNSIKEGKHLSIEPSFDRIVMIETNHDENTIDAFREKHPAFFEEAWKFTVVRNPWDKYVSGWRYCHTTKSRKFERVVKSPPTRKEDIHDWHHMTRTQTECIVNGDGEPIVDFVCRFERLQDDFDTICDRADFPRIALPMIRKTDHQRYREYYDENTRDIIAERYRQDIEAFGYSY